ncbi:SPFH domain-containing protein [Natrarchaeobaculum sulfurireducens]|uniref:SnoaL-like domain-containing protein n=1 Tax=Natrarchaeobaculum sulfurireducens TaxID=2044521 RepID=A0A346PBI7_9EURY|nr:DUF3225 domain-containing protein [Natrarchaeobaculum sulfurireducens]AXR76882.1 hypothetical protein AArc1_0538 [Natrarchaeobaculum sulfurireducens]AXR80548.1 hypothetical protein AArcMg_0525 [Natrarchaeobaculum sulfurireducens]
MSDRAEDTVRDYYDALRVGEPLEPYFLEADSTVKYGISDALYGYEDVAEALREQTATTEDWTIESHALVVDEREGFATFADEVTMAWRAVDTDDTDEERHFETRWSGTLVPAANRTVVSETDEVDEKSTWRFTTMHVSTAGAV